MVPGQPATQGASIFLRDRLAGSTTLLADSRSSDDVDVDLDGTGIDLHSGHVFRADMDYDGTTLQVTITDVETDATAFQSYEVDIPGVVGDDTAWVGFTGATGGYATVADIRTWKFQPSDGIGQTLDFSTGFDDPSGLKTNGTTFITDSLARLTSGEYSQAGTIFSEQRVDVRGFTNTFTFQMLNDTSPMADGITFTIQNDSPGRVGDSGGNLGYGGIGNSIAIKFDLWAIDGVVENSTGLLIGGGSGTSNLSVSDDGRYVTFDSGAVGLSER